MKVEALEFEFHETDAAFQYDGYPGLQRHWRGKVVDVVVNQPAAATRTVWLVEVKDFRVMTQPPLPANLRQLAVTVATKASDTVAALTAHAEFPEPAKLHAQLASGCGRFRVVLHLEPHAGPHSRLFPVNFAANVRMKLRQLVRHLDTHALVVDCARTGAAGVPWTVK
jgi:hypothetical protein